MRYRKPEIWVGLLLLLAAAVGCRTAGTPDPPPDPLAGLAVQPRTDWAPTLDSAGYHPDSVAVLLFVPDENALHAYNPTEALRPLPPGATANLPLALMGLQRGLLAGDTLTVQPEVSPFPGTQRIALATVLQQPSVRFFADLVAQVGAHVAATEMLRLGFTRTAFAPETERFWQDGSLLVSLHDQVRFTYSLLHPGGVVEPMAAKTVLQATVQEKAGPFTCGGKTGWPITANADSTAPVNVGWWVGWVMRGDRYAIVAIRVWTQRKVKNKWTDPLRATCLALLQREGWWVSPQ